MSFLLLSVLSQHTGEFTQQQKRGNVVTDVILLRGLVYSCKHPYYLILEQTTAFKKKSIYNTLLPKNQINWWRNSVRYWFILQT